MILTFPLRAVLAVVLGCFSCSLTTAIECTVKTLDENHSEKFIRIEDQELVIQSVHAERQISVSQLLSIEFPTQRSSFADDEYGEVQTKLGSRVCLSRFEVQGDQIVFTPGFNLESRLSIAKAELKAILLPQQLSDADREYWQEVCQSEVTTDQLIVRGRSSGSLRSIEGFIESFNSEGINFQIEGDLISVAWERLFGVIFYSEATTPLELIDIKTNDGSVLKAISIDADNLAAVAHLSEDQSISLPLAAIESMDFSAGKLFWLDELPRLKSSWSRQPGVPDFINYDPRFGESLRGDALSLLHVDPRLEGITQEIQHDKGIAMRTGSIIQLLVPETGRKLKGLLGIDPLTSRSGAVALELSLGNEVLFEGDLIGGAAPIELDLLLPPSEAIGRVLTLKVKASSEGTSGGNLHFVDARITK